MSDDDSYVFEHHGHIIAGALAVVNNGGEFGGCSIDLYVDDRAVGAAIRSTGALDAARFEVKALAALAAAGWTPDPDLDDWQEPFEDGTERREREMDDDAAAREIGD